MLVFIRVLQETNKMERVRVQSSFDHVFVVDCVGLSGGLALLRMVDSGVEI